MRTILATAPIRICDCGGWTDTWFARYGSVFQICVEPGVRVTVTLTPAFGAPPPVRIDVGSYGDRYEYTPGTQPWQKHPLIEAAIDSVGVPSGAETAIAVESAVPPGASTGTSASVCVALIGALQAASGIQFNADAIASAAHAVETRRLNQQSGVQDQLAATHGGINFVDVFDYPGARVHPLAVSFPMRAALERQMLLVYLGRTHQSSSIHDAVVRDVVGVGADHPVIAQLRQIAVSARDAVLADDLVALGAAMRANTEAQRRLHPLLVSPDATRVIDLARGHGALGWKVNGAGGEGGSVTILCGPDPETRDATEDAVERAGSGYRVIPFRLAANGLRVWDAPR